MRSAVVVAICLLASVCLVQATWYGSGMLATQFSANLCKAASCGFRLGRHCLLSECTSDLIAQCCPSSPLILPPQLVSACTAASIKSSLRVVLPRYIPLVTLTVLSCLQERHYAQLRDHRVRHLVHV